MAAISHSFHFVADWEWAPAKVTYRPQWKPFGTTPKMLKLAANRAFRIKTTSLTPASDLPAILTAATNFEIRSVSIPLGWTIKVNDLGDCFAKLKNVHSVGLFYPHSATYWFGKITLEGGRSFTLELEHWNVDDVMNAFSRIPKANELKIRTDDFGDDFSLQPLLQIKGFREIEIQHKSYCDQSLDWTGLSTQTELEKFRVHAGYLAETFWKEFGQLKKLETFEPWWPRKAKANPGDLKKMTILKSVKGNCLFDSTPELFTALAECPNLESAHIDQLKLDDDMCAAIGSMKNLKDCYLWNTPITDRGMQSLCCWPKIESLTLTEGSSTTTPVTEVGFAALGKLKTLQALKLQGFDGVGPKGWTTLQKLTNLKELELSVSKSSCDPLEVIGPLPTLEKLKLSNSTSITAAGYAHLEAMPNLHTFRLYGYFYSKPYIPTRELAETKQLRHLSLSMLKDLRDQDIHELMTLKNLEELVLYETPKISDRAFTNLPDLRKLRTLYLEKLPKLTDAIIDVVLACQRLTTLSLRCSVRFTETGYAKLVGAKKLKTLHLTNARNLSSTVLHDIVKNLKLEELLIEDTPELEDSDLMELTKVKSLKRVSIGAAKRVTGDGLKAMYEARPDWSRAKYSMWSLV